jgi:hypothetical protein
MSLWKSTTPLVLFEALREEVRMTSLASAGGVRWRLHANVRKSVLLVHIASAGAWLGIDLGMAVLVGTALVTDDPRTKALSLQALDLFVVWLLFTIGMVCLLSGIALGVSSRYGLIHYWWVAIKLALNIVLTSLVLVALRPEVDEAAERGRQYLAGTPVSLAVGDLIHPPIVSTTALLVAMLLAVFKPWGRIRTNKTTH